MEVTPAELMVIGFPAGSNAKLSGAEMVDPFVVHVDVPSSATTDSAMKASL